jgi:hypothetical protein
MAYQAPDHITPKNLKKISDKNAPATTGYGRPEPVTGKDPKTTRTTS